MFCADETTATAIRRAYEEEGELSAAVVLRRFFPGIADNANARRCARTIAGWMSVDNCLADGRGKHVRQSTTGRGKRRR
jgi:hypothetical protein